MRIDDIDWPHFSGRLRVFHLDEEDVRGDLLILTIKDGVTTTDVPQYTVSRTDRVALPERAFILRFSCDGAVDWFGVPYRATPLGATHSHG